MKLASHVKDKVLKGLKMKLDPNIKSMILRESGARREKRIRIAMSDEEHTRLMIMSIEKDMTMAELIRKKLFEDEDGTNYLE